MSFVLFSLLAWSGAGALLLGRLWRHLDRGVSWACLAAGLAVASTALLIRDLQWLDSISSDAGRVGSLGETVYSGAKGGLIAFTKSLARETARYNINVNCVCPGPTETPLLFAVPEKHLEAFRKAIPFRRFGKPAEVAAAVVFFASDQSSYVTGQVLSVSGGLTIVG